MPPSIVASPVPSNTLPLLIWDFHTLFSKHAYLCMIPIFLSSITSNVFSVTSKDLLTTVFTSNFPRLPFWHHIPMRTRRVTWILVERHQDTVCSWGENLILLSSKCQLTVSCSSTKARYRAVAHVVVKIVWLRQLLSEIHRPIEHATIVYCDNISAVCMSSNPVHHRRTKHVDIDIHFVREKVALGHVPLLHVPTSAHFAYIFTRGLLTTPLNDIRFSLISGEHVIDNARRLVFKENS